MRTGFGKYSIDDNGLLECCEEEKDEIDTQEVHATTYMYIDLRSLGRPRLAPRLTIRSGSSRKPPTALHLQSSIPFSFFFSHHRFLHRIRPAAGQNLHISSFGP